VNLTKVSVAAGTVEVVALSEALAGAREGLAAMHLCGVCSQLACGEQGLLARGTSVPKRALTPKQ
jgi:hypothetical protein